MIATKQQRRRDSRLKDRGVPMVGPSVPPSGPAGGDLGGTYPDPTVNSLGHVAAGGSLSGMMDAPTVNSINGIAASGDLSGTFPGPVVTSIANVTVGPAVYPAGSGALLTNVAAPATLQSGLVMLDNSGIAGITTVGNPTAVVATAADIGGGMTGIVRVQPLGGNSWNIESSAGSADSGWQVFWMAF